MAKTSYNSTEDMIIKIQSSKGTTKLKISEKISTYYDKVKIRMDEDPFARKAQGIRKIYHEVLFLLKYLQTKPQVENVNSIYYDLYCTVNKIRDDKEIVNDKY